MTAVEYSVFIAIYGFGVSLYGAYAVHVAYCHRHYFMPWKRAFDKAKAAKNLRLMEQALAMEQETHEYGLLFFWWRQNPPKLPGAEYDFTDGRPE